MNDGFNGFKINNEKTKMFTKHDNGTAKSIDGEDWVSDWEKVKYCGITMTNMNCMPFQNNYIKIIMSRYGVKLTQIYSEKNTIIVWKNLCGKNRYVT